LEYEKKPDKNIAEGEFMDTGEGVFKLFTDDKVKKKLFEAYPDHGGVFKVGEIVELRGSKFRIKSIKPKELRLKLLAKAGV